MVTDPPQIYLALSAILFCLGVTGVCVRRNPLVMFMCIEMMLNAANLAFATFARYSSQTGNPGEIVPNGLPIFDAVGRGGPADGPIFVFLVMTIAAAEAVVGLAIIIAIFRSRSDVDADDLASLKG